MHSSELSCGDTYLFIKPDNAINDILSKQYNSKTITYFPHYN